MHRLKVAATILFLTSLAGGLANAGSRGGVTPPAEFPPAGYTGKEYVDSRGCVYVRVSVNGKTGWVARAGRDHKQLCRRPRAMKSPASQHQIRQSAPGSSYRAKYRLPPGYIRAWNDGRLNPERGPRTAQGDVQMDRIWARTVPRRLMARPRVRTH